MKYCLFIYFIVASSFAQTPFGGVVENKRTDQRIVMVCDELNTENACSTFSFFLMPTVSAHLAGEKINESSLNFEDLNQIQLKFMEKLKKPDLLSASKAHNEWFQNWIDNWRDYYLNTQQQYQGEKLSIGPALTWIFPLAGIPWAVVFIADLVKAPFYMPIQAIKNSVLKKSFRKSLDHLMEDKRKIRRINNKNIKRLINELGQY